jgi:hypothetical protein
MNKVTLKPFIADKVLVVLNVSEIVTKACVISMTRCVGVGAGCVSNAGRRVQRLVVESATG